MKVRFKSSFPRMIDGAAVGPFSKNEERSDLDPALVKTFLASGMVEEVVANAEPESEPAATAKKIVTGSGKLGAGPASTNKSKAKKK